MINNDFSHSFLRNCYRLILIAFFGENSHKSIIFSPGKLMDLISWLTWRLKLFSTIFKLLIQLQLLRASFPWAFTSIFRINFFIWSLQFRRITRSENTNSAEASWNYDLPKTNHAPFKDSYTIFHLVIRVGSVFVR